MPALLTLALFLALCAPASAGVVTAGSFDVTYDAEAREANRLTLEAVDGGVRLTDPAARLLAGSGCEQEGDHGAFCATGAYQAVCMVAGGEICGTAFTARLGDLDDEVTVIGDLASRLEGGGGNDRLLGGEAADVLDGGAGSDFLKGNGGFDSVGYDDRSESVRVTLDDVPDDGAAGEGDDVRVERVTGGGGDDVLIGNAADNGFSGGPGGDDVVRAGAGADVIGGSGLDRLRAGPGNDSIAYDETGPFRRRGARCGSGRDVVSGGEPALTSLDCESAYPSVFSPARLAVTAHPCRSRRLPVTVTDDVLTPFTDDADRTVLVELLRPGGRRLQRTKARAPSGRARFRLTCPRPGRYVVAAVRGDGAIARAVFMRR